MPFSFSGCLILGYLLGSIPAGYFLLQWRRKIDLRYAGSGNVGAMNAFEVSESKWLGISVLLIDACKGAVAVGIAWLVVGGSFIHLSATAVGAVFGHNYPVWLRGKGGRGLATGAGALFVFCWIVPATWILLWLIIYVASKNIHIANIAVSFAVPPLMLLIPDALYRGYLQVPADRWSVFATASFICLLILLRHIQPAMEMWKSKNHQSHSGNI